RGPGGDGLPRYIAIPRQPFMTQPVYLGVSHAAFATGDPSVTGFRPPNLTLGAGMNGERLGDRRCLLRQFDRYRRELDATGSLDGMDRFDQEAFDLLTNPAVAAA